jgi:hypothetical protein|tara:strand:+ start:792 stop:1142 length:351 start_codon:yes stop_codon:yes gene_type:complete
MSKLAVYILGLVLVFAPVYAQQTPDIKKLTLVHDCGPAGRVLPFLQEKYGEEPFAFGSAGVALAPGGEPIEGVLLMNVNPKTLTYTINILFPKDRMVCMLVAGDEFRPATGSKNKK